GIEALSRGAADVTFVEHDARAQALIQRNVAGCGIGSGYTIVRLDAVGALRSFVGRAAFDIIVLDPPYDQGADETERVLSAAGELMADRGVAVLEHPRRAVVPGAAGRLARVRQLESGDSALTFYERL